MRKKYLSALLFGALLFASAGTFTSCKDYDDDIDGLRTELTELKNAVSELQSAVDNGDYVTNVEKSAEGLVITFKTAGPKTITLEDQVGSTVEVKGGVLYIDGVAQDFAVAPGTETQDQIIIENGMWSVLQEDGTYKSTGVPVSGVTVSGSQAEGFVFTIYDADGTKQEVELPSAASLITSIVLENGYGAAQPSLQIIKAKFNYTETAKWAGPKTLPSNESVIYSANKGIEIRVNPVDAPATEVAYTLVNSKNQELTNVELAAKANDDLLTINDAHGRAAGTNNGLYTLEMKDFTLSKSDAKTFEDDFAKKNNEYNTVAFAINANVSTRSAYDVQVNELKDAEKLDKIAVKKGNDIVTDSEVILNDNGTATSPDATIEVNVGQSYTIDEATAAQGALYDMYFTIDEADIDAFGIIYDDATRTFKVGKNPDVVTTRPIGFNMTVHTLDTKGNVEEAIYRVNLSSIITSDVFTYDAVTYDIANLVDTKTDNNGFNIAISELKAALGDNWTAWVNSVDVRNTQFALYTDAKCEKEVSGTGITASHASFTIEQQDKDNEAIGGGAATTNEVRSLDHIYVGVNKENQAKLSLDKQYYLKVTFKTTKTTSTPATEVNSIVVPVTFTAPSVADQFTPDANFVVNNVITAYFYTTEKKINVERYFTKSDQYATLSLDDKTTLATVGDKKYESDDLAKVQNPTTAAKSPVSIESDAYITLEKVEVEDETGLELGYKKNLIVKAHNDNFANTGWTYGESSDKDYQFTVSIISPIYEGTVTPVGTTSIPVIANNATGYAITGSMITGTDYNDNDYSVVPDQAGVGSTIKDMWSNWQVVNVTAKPDNEQYISDIEMREPKAATDTEPAVEGAIVVKATPMPNTTPTSISVTVQDVWGYKKTVEVPVTIQVNK